MRISHKNLIWSANGDSNSGFASRKIATAIVNIAAVGRQSRSDPLGRYRRASRRPTVQFPLCGSAEL
jgi:hypothetical protein